MKEALKGEIFFPTWIRRLNIVKITSSSQLELQIQCNLNQNPGRLPCGYWQTDSKAYVWTKATEQLTQYPRRIKSRTDITLLDMKTCFRAMVIKTVCIGKRIDKIDQWNKVEGSEVWHTQIQPTSI